MCLFSVCKIHILLMLKTFFSFLFLLKSELDHVRETHSYFVAKCDAVH